MVNSGGSRHCAAGMRQQSQGRVTQTNEPRNAMHDENDLIHSPLSQTYAADGCSVEIHIYRMPTTGWTLEVVDDQNNSTVWDGEFATDQEALDMALADINAEGIAAFIAGPPSSAPALSMASQQDIAADLRGALTGSLPFSEDLYRAVLAEHEDVLKASLDRDADDALLCMLADEGEVAMLVIEWDGHIHRNDDALKRLREMWHQSFETNIETLLPTFAEHISRRNLGVAGLKWMPPEPN